MRLMGDEERRDMLAALERNRASVQAAIQVSVPTTRKPIRI